jgi:hypothetical protein
MSHALEVFVSSTCHNLRDLRAALAEALRQLGMQPLLSDEAGFPHEVDIPPYATCLPVLETCLMVVGIIERAYGMKFDDWGPYPQYKGLSPTHAELRHALDKGKKLYLYVQKDVMAFYEQWRRNKADFEKLKPPNGLDLATLEMLSELKLRQPAPWIEQFDNVNDLIQSLRKQFVNEVFARLRLDEERRRDQVQHYMDQLAKEKPEVRAQLSARLTEAVRNELPQVIAEAAATGSLVPEKKP